MLGNETSIVVFYKFLNFNIIKILSLILNIK